MKEIALSKNGKNKNLFVSFVDDDDYDFLVSLGNWSVTKWGYAAKVIDGKFIGMHRLILRASKGETVNHIDRNPLNNCRANLRIVSKRPVENKELIQLRAEKAELIEALEIARSALMKGTAYKTGEVMVIDGALAKARGEVDHEREMPRV